MLTDTICGRCGEPIYEEDSHNRKPCSKCGATKRTYSLTCAVSVTASLTATAEVLRPASAFLEVARSLADQDDRMAWNLSVVATLVACEIATERTIVQVAKAKGQDSVVDSLRSEDRTFKMQVPKVRSLYAQLTGDDIEKPEEDWRRYIAAKDLRNAVLHEGRQSTREEATETLKTGTAFVKRLEKHKPAER